MTQQDRIRSAIADVSKFDTEQITSDIDMLTRAQAEELYADPGVSAQATARIQNLRAALNRDFKSRDEFVEIALASFIAHIPAVALGPPGTAKSMVLRVMAEYLGLRTRSVELSEFIEDVEKRFTDDKTQESRRPPRRYFEYLITRFTTADELLGPPHLDLMIRRAEFYRQSAGLLPEAQVAFLDEVFKANSAILNALLSIINERIFYNAGQPVRIPLSMVFGASNEAPADEELDALYDRFPIRVMCNPVPNDAQIILDTLDLSNRHAADAILPPQDNHKVERQQIACVNDFKLMSKLQTLAELNWQPGSRANFRKDFVETFRRFRSDFHISDRTLGRLYRLCFSLAILRNGGAAYPTFKEHDVFKYCFREPEAAGVLSDAVDDRIARLAQS